MLFSPNHNRKPGPKGPSAELVHAVVEMKRLMIDVVDRTYRFIHTLFDENTGGQLLLRLAERDPLPQWNEPTLSTTGAQEPA
jgi:hypothetical protein